MVWVSNMVHWRQVPNVIGLVLGTGQLVLYAIYRRGAPQKPILAPPHTFALEIAAEKIAPAPNSGMQTQKPIVPVTMAPNNV